jgi:histone acetyltransferase (RNA polymerase elongator complex component)
MKRRVLPFWFPNMGCSSRCLFCDQQMTQGEAFEMPSPADIAATILEAAARESQLPLEAAFFGGTFTALPWPVQEALLAPATELRQNGLLAGIRVSTHPAFVDHESMARLRHSGVTTVELGIQSFASPVLALSGRKYDEAQALAACAVVTEAELELVVQLMPMLPSALADDDLHSARIVANLKPQGVRLFPTLVLANTGLEEWYRAGRYVPPTLDQTALRVSQMLEVIGLARIPVLRIGLQSSERLDRAVVAGPYHPALGELCWSALLARLAVRGLQRVVASGVQPPTLRVAPSLASLVTGHDQAGLKSITEALGAGSFLWALEGPPQGLTGTVLWQSGQFKVSYGEQFVWVER